MGAARRLFSLFNRAFMVPMFRLGLGSLVGNPITGYIMVLRTTGRRSGKTRHTPVNYALLDGSAYCLSGWGRSSHWFRNVLATPEVEAVLPGGVIRGLADEVTDPQERLRAARQVLKNGGFAGFLLGFNPRTASDAVVRDKVAGYPVMRIRPTGVGSGAGDPGGWLWLLAVAGALLAAALVLRWRASCI